MEHYEHSKFGINWAEYQTMFPGESKSVTINRMTEIVMIQSLMEKALKLLDRGIKIQKPIVLNPHWRGLVEEEKWKGNWLSYRDHQSLSHKIEKLNFIDLKYRVLLLFVTSRRVTAQFKKELVEALCTCRYDEHNRIKSCNEKKKGKKNEKIRKDEEQDDNAEVDDNEDDEMKAQDELLLTLKAETEMKTLTEQQMLSLLKNIAKTVVESEHEEGDVLKVNKYVIMDALDLMAWGLAGCDNSEPLGMI
ncbi:hypothetical protein GCK72_007749 [Caenorhabditis remanei]|uniref:SPK domain-containing protein n=1 Tax=Caenorhabditis remanei TaxID=31234 RepID=A0A6A5HI26_CAERE|nr:hypothetical protein GCK72_007752 [Caenorhabditis remanei]XP_053590609.1 hypothetical protein GCK72_007741 [Caenorhabditis remanei]XP_053590616.1 hypothetical protein GCK72_007749 [Caenorhabditis remanei]KAF1767782.1 hypothetical protein GCK72_007741 [Caenorhabditis remanei]KAF1767790.1 hypothetical protein GCK72_007749 [Caenorhabditis remanei]KAF1767793.1 hypothetical protein GCK72_007752 [Caenorhabditis remanei]